MGYHRKLVYSGDILELYIYDKEIKTGEEVLQNGRGLQKRVVRPFSRKRSDNVLRSKRHFVRRVLSQVEKSGSPLFVTCTFSDVVSDVGVGYSFLRKFILRLREVFGDVEAVAVGEYQQRGALHYHLLMWGLPFRYGDVRSGRTLVSVGDERSERVLARAWGQGFVDCMQTDGSYRLILYFAKYMLKAVGDERFGGYRKLYYATRGIAQPFVFTDDDTIDFVLSKVEDKGIISEADFNTAWLGKVNKKTYVRNKS